MGKRKPRTHLRNASLGGSRTLWRLICCGLRETWDLGIVTHRPAAGTETPKGTVNSSTNLSFASLAEYPGENRVDMLGMVGEIEILLNLGV